LLDLVQWTLGYKGKPNIKNQNSKLQSKMQKKRCLMLNATDTESKFISIAASVPFYAPKAASKRA